MRLKIEGRGVIAIEWTRVLDYLSLAKPELTLLSVLTAVAGYCLGAGGSVHPGVLLSVAAGTGMVGGGAGALNQYMERRFDILMKRTERRPLPAGRLLPVEALTFGTFLSVAGIVYLGLATNVLTAFLAAVTSVTYLFLYTPLKRITPWSTLVGGIPGALPPVMGWTAARNAAEPGAWILFGILFLWQMPHFLSLAWLYRDDYKSAGYRLLTVLDTSGERTSRHVVAATIGLLPVSLMLSATGTLGWVYAAGSFSLGCLFLIPALRLAGRRTNAGARQLFIASLAYLPLLMAMMAVDRLIS
jgi:heme o synthase